MLKKRLTREYQEALKGSDRQKALAAGREYYRFFRSDGKITIYDEQAIDNDMKMMPPEKVSVVVDQSNNVIDQLERLAKLKENGTLSESEFLEQKIKILNN
ncbi:SHOCT domain-containing protein [Marinifilum sp. D737]|uniref:SHOCT domain-containing protein n=1 Tax=Marinifilum sp. D737 TaxID=2969628 RepID=UPI002274C836|nr:SHOCT domain-containing protein [Marinifilum sp. D737]MCY1633946.1 SHOCT domain-containing protein [Marinifilum sp. D737]